MTTIPSFILCRHIPATLAFSCHEHTIPRYCAMFVLLCWYFAGLLFLPIPGVGVGPVHAMRSLWCIADLELYYRRIYAVDAFPSWLPFFYHPIFCRCSLYIPAFALLLPTITTIFYLPTCSFCSGGPVTTRSSSYLNNLFSPNAVLLHFRSCIFVLLYFHHCSIYILLPVFTSYYYYACSIIWPSLRYSICHSFWSFLHFIYSSHSDLFMVHGLRHAFSATIVHV